MEGKEEGEKEKKRLSILVLGKRLARTKAKSTQLPLLPSHSI